MTTIPSVNVSSRDALDQVSWYTSSEVWVSDEVCRVFQWIIMATLSQLVCVGGTVTNIINILCFLKQGVKDSVNISLFGLAVSDLGSLITLIFSNVCYTPAFQDSDLPFDFPELQYLVGGWPHVICARITSWITALIMIERCLCITMPMKVKSLFTPTRVKAMVIIIFIIFICSVIPVYCVNSYGWRFSPQRNRTILGLVFSPDREVVDTFTFAIINIGMSYSAFIIVLICSIILAIHLKRKFTWRVKSITARKSQDTSNRDLKLARMILTLSSLFIVCYFPMCIVFICCIFIPGVSVEGQNRNTAFVIGFFGVFLESTNSAMNIFIYYSMSTNYKTAFRNLFAMGTQKVQ